ncbi:hypothetical protein GGX14DRAFT_561167 [Mycena pura]|uniref:Uncharacterized protein n=1 Tax=Mycena pura TaxID=153505 RepID=A0AAD6VRQ9_9AGAR|nr:hypothetical protein GGX14DRAFT_561167 [Mycena pura]
MPTFIASRRSPRATRAGIGAQHTHPRPAASTHSTSPPAALYSPCSFPARSLPIARTLVAHTCRTRMLPAARCMLRLPEPLAVASCTLPAARCTRCPRTICRILLVQIPPPATQYVPQGIGRAPTRPRRNQLWPQQVPKTLRFGCVNRRPPPTTSWSPPATRRGSPPAARLPLPHRPAKSSACPALPGTHGPSHAKLAPAPDRPLPPGDRWLQALAASCSLPATCHPFPAAPASCQARRLPLVARCLLPASSDTFPVPPRRCLLHVLITQSPLRARASTRTHSLDAAASDSRLNKR